MPQTVAMVRGTATASANPNNTNTIFTNTASGLGTRVICNMLTVWYTGPYTSLPDSTSGRISIIHTSSGGSSQIIGRYATYSTGNSSGTMTLASPPAYAMQFNIFPSMVNAPPMQMASAGQGTSYLYPSYGPQGMIYVNQSGTTVPALISSSNNIGQWEPAYGTSGSFAKTFNFMPQNFWIGPSDTIQIRTSWYGYFQSGKSQNYGYQTVNVGYSFTTITES